MRPPSSPPRRGTRPIHAAYERGVRRQSAKFQIFDEGLNLIRKDQYGRPGVRYVIVLEAQQSRRSQRVNTMSVRSTIVSQFEEVAKEQKKKLAVLSDDMVLLDSDLDSLCFAIIVARLEDILGYDPFSASEAVDFPVTFGDFVKFYEDAAK